MTQDLTPEREEEVKKIIQMLREPGHACGPSCKHLCCTLEQYQVALDRARAALKRARQSKAGR